MGVYDEIKMVVHKNVLTTRDVLAGIYFVTGNLHHNFQKIASKLKNMKQRLERDSPRKSN